MRKTNNLTKLLALVLSLVMMCSMSVSAFAAEVADVEYTQDGENCEVITIDLDEVLANAEEVNLNGRTVLTLAASTLGKTNIGTLSAGQSVTINVTWSSTSLPLHVGLMKTTASSGNLVSVTGGSASITATVNSAGTYYLVVANPSTTTALIVNVTYSK